MRGTETHMKEAYKFGSIPKDEQRYEYPNIFAYEQTSGPERLIIARSTDHVSTFVDLLQHMHEPLGMLYVLAVPRGGSNAGRYETANPVSREEARWFLRNFGDYFEND